MAVVSSEFVDFVSLVLYVCSQPDRLRQRAAIPFNDFIAPCWQSPSQRNFKTKNMGRRSPFSFPSTPFPYSWLSCPFLRPFFPLEVAPLNPAVGSGERWCFYLYYMTSGGKTYNDFPETTCTGLIY